MFKQSSGKILCAVVLAALCSAVSDAKNVASPKSGKKPTVPKVFGYIFRFHNPPLLRGQELGAKARAQGLTPAAAIQKDHWEFESFLSLSTTKKISPALNNPKYSYLPEAVYNGVVIAGLREDEAAKLVAANPAVFAEYAPNLEYQANLAESVPLTGAQQVWPQVRNGVPLDGTGARIGIIDSGIDYSHADLGCGEKSGCRFPTKKVIGGHNFISPDKPPMDDFGHGTHVSAIAAGEGTYLAPNGARLPLPGVAPGAKLYAFKVLDENGSGSGENIIKAIGKCVEPAPSEKPLDVCNLSLGSRNGTYHDPVVDAVDTATLAGVTFVISAGNYGKAKSIGSPGSARSAITVGAACKPNENDPAACPDQIARFSSQGPVGIPDSNQLIVPMTKPDLLSYGYKICAAQHGSWLSEKQCAGPNHIAISGTSMSAPHVTGMVAIFRKAHPEKTPFEVKQTLIATSQPLFGATQKLVAKNTQGAGLANIEKALSALEVEDTSPPTIEINTKKGIIQGITPVIVTSTVRDNVGVKRVEYYYASNSLHASHDGSGDGKKILIGTSELAPYALSLPKSIDARGGTITAKAIDFSKNSAETLPVPVVVNKRTLEFLDPLPGSVRSGSDSGRIVMNDYRGVEEFSTYISGHLVGNNSYRKGDPYSPQVPKGGVPIPLNINTYLVPTNGRQPLKTVVQFADGSEFESDPIYIDVQNDRVLPTVEILSPTAGEEVGPGVILLEAEASDNVGVEFVFYYVDGVYIGGGTKSGGFKEFWVPGASKFSEGHHSLTAVAQDGAFNQSEPSLAVDIIIKKY